MTDKTALPLKTARVNEGFTQFDLAQVAGLTQTTLSFIENGLVQPQETTRERLESILGSIDWVQTYNKGRVNYKHQPRKEQVPEVQG
ncbi:MAG: helix-turn-helix transcriptional regulator [Balneolales bacterium]